MLGHAGVATTGKHYAHTNLVKLSEEALAEPGEPISWEKAKRDLGL